MTVPTTLAFLIALSLPLWLVFEALHQLLVGSPRWLPARREHRASAPARQATPVLASRMRSRQSSATDPRPARWPVARATAVTQTGGGSE